MTPKQTEALTRLKAAVKGKGRDDYHVVGHKGRQRLPVHIVSHVEVAPADIIEVGSAIHPELLGDGAKKTKLGEIISGSQNAADEMFVVLKTVDVDRVIEAIESPSIKVD